MDIFENVNCGLVWFFQAEIRASPTKPCGKGSKRKQDELDEEDEEEGEHQTWVEALTQELGDEDPEEDPDYEVGCEWLFFWNVF